MEDDDSALDKSAQERLALTAQALAAVSQIQSRQDAPFIPPKLRITEDGQFARCVSPQEALTKINLSTKQLSVSQLHRELQSERVQAIAHEAVYRNFLENGELGRVSFPLLDPWVWALASPKYDADFWETGYFEAYIPDRQFGYVGQRVIEFFDVRFWPDTLPGGIDRIFAAPVEGSDPVLLPDSSPAKPPLSRSEAEKFCAAILLSWPTATQDWAWEQALRFFPEHAVPRDWFRSILRSTRGPQRPGKRPKERL